MTIQIVEGGGGNTTSVATLGDYTFTNRFTPTTESASVGGNLLVAGSGEIGTDLSVVGSETVAGNLTVNGITDLVGATNVTGNLSTDANLDVTGNCTIDGAGTVTGALTAGGNLTLSGSGARIRGDFGSGTRSNRVLFQSSTTNGATSIGAIPNGTNTNSASILFNGSNPDTCANLATGITSTNTYLSAGIRPGGSYLPLDFSVDNATAVRITASGTSTAGSNPLVLIGATTTADTVSKLQVTGAATVSGNFTAGNLSVSGNTTAPTIQGSTSASGNLTLTSTSDATKGYVITDSKVLVNTATPLDNGSGSANNVGTLDVNGNVRLAAGKGVIIGPSPLTINAGYNALYCEGAASTSSQITLRNNNPTGTSTGGGNILLQYSNNSGLPSGSFDRLGLIAFGSVDGTTPRNAAAIVSFTDGTWSSSTPGPASTPSCIGLWTCPTGSTTRLERMRVFQSGNMMVGPTSGTTFTDDTVNKLQVNGTVKSTQYRLADLNTAPSSATDTGTKGEIRVTADAIYVCTATNTWVKAALATW